MGTSKNGRYLNTKGSGRSVSDFALVHSSEGAFTRSQTRVNGEMVIKLRLNNGGHSQYFFNVANCGGLVTEVDAVLSMLPQPLQENLARGYAAFSAQGDISDDANDELFEECDDVFYEHEQLIIDIIYEAAKSFTL